MWSKSLPLDEDTARQIYPVYLRLTETHLLELCLKGLTQNGNESLHNCVWGLLPKVRFFARYRLDHGAAQVVLVFNQGLSAVSQQLECLNWGKESFTLEIKAQKDMKGISQAKYSKTTQAANRKRVREAAVAEAERRANKQPALDGPGIAKLVHFYNSVAILLLFCITDFPGLLKSS